MSQTAPIDVAIIGGGQAGLSMSYHLTQHGIDHIVLEQGYIAESWRNKRWDSFKLVTPNWTICLPGFTYEGNDPDGFMPRDEVVRYLETYATSFHAPIQCGVRVTSISQKEKHYVIETTTTSPFVAKNVVIATGGFQQPKDWPIMGEKFAGVQHLHSSEYRNPQELTSGNVLVVGSGQSGCQIAEELNQSGRKVYLAISNCGRLPRRYRGHDITWWQKMAGVFEMTVDQLPSPQLPLSVEQARLSCNPHIAPGHEINLHLLERDGVVLLGRVQAIQGSQVTFAPNLEESLTKADQFAHQLKALIDRVVQMKGIPVPEENDLTDTMWKEQREGTLIRALDMKTQGITNVIWATGYKLDYSWIHIPVFDKTNYPMHKRGVTSSPGLYFLGLHWLYKNKSDLLYGVGEDAAFLAEEIATR